MDGTATVWLAVLAIATTIQTLATVGVLFVLIRMVQRLTDHVTRLQRDHLEPLVSRITAGSAAVSFLTRRHRTDGEDRSRPVAVRYSEGVKHVRH